MSEELVIKVKEGLTNVAVLVIGEDASNEKIHLKVSFIGLEEGAERPYEESSATWNVMNFLMHDVLIPMLSSDKRVEQPAASEAIN